ncbi:hypothetical protein MGYG_04860 [Nannizzia gypsea CBS 118893]|uniref:Uncharacterized protein n=1 Tax=Arthroderma gypseum (strain ATCC MYA-4604 / CBS 118893) TaxID=535722 RepID=E4UX62_ARTGP|nr:hypothetical protein MGYG_04860 [Nannizzia gypsea CBS 118893]EFR01862.1 hypothetical protein MGYG_04860 [Nannizzia gypsea CBS 118893]
MLPIHTAQMAFSSFMAKRWARRRFHLLIAVFLATVVCLSSNNFDPVIPLKTPLPYSRYGHRSHHGNYKAKPTKPYVLRAARKDDNTVEMVIASKQQDNVTWLNEYLPSWKKNIYVVDDSFAELSIPDNKGREAMVFLTYIIDRYDSLPGNIFFHHAQRFKWHNDDPNYDALNLLQRFRLGYLKEQGYTSLRCDWALGCPAAIRPWVDAIVRLPGEDISSKHLYKKSFEQLFPGQSVPETVGVACCSQFAVRREIIQQRPKSDYIRYRKWLLDTELGDHISGRIFEYSWHIMFGKKAIHCPNASSCYCRMYGLCHMTCESKRCNGQYFLPKFANLPAGWPKIGWNKEDRHWSGPE